MEDTIKFVQCFGIKQIPISAMPQLALTVKAHTETGSLPLQKQGDSSLQFVGSCGLSSQRLTLDTRTAEPQGSRLHSGIPQQTAGRGNPILLFPA